MSFHRLLLVMLAVLCLSSFLNAQSNQTGSLQEMKGPLSIDMQWFLSYLNGEELEQSFNRFALKRGYVNIKKQINKTFSGRITTDVTVDKEGDGMGDVEMRLKYLYLKTNVPSFSILHKPYFETGLVHRPWLDFQEHINVYRVQGTMFMERVGILNSADFGVVFVSSFGGEMDDDYKKKVNKHHAGKYGSMALGVFNGGGYHALEMNENKTIEGRLTLRPMPEILPGLQLTYHGAAGKGNIEQEPDWNFSNGFLSYECEQMVLTGEYYQGNGNSKGNVVQDTVTYKAVPQKGYSLFGEFKLFNKKTSLFGRYDNFTKEYNSGDVKFNRIIAGLAFYITKSSKIIFDYDKLKYSNKKFPGSDVFEIAIELKY